MDVLLLMIVMLVGYILMYKLYGKYIAKFIFKLIFKLNPDAKVPPKELEDGVDYVPTRKEIIFGHHLLYCPQQCKIER